MVIGSLISNYHLPIANYPWLSTAMGQLLISHALIADRLS